MNNQFSKKDRVLVIASHPDDDILGCGGTLAYLRSIKIKVKVLFLAEGVSARFNKDELLSKKFIKASKIRHDSALKALKIIDVNEYEFQDRLCTRFDEIPLLDLVKAIEKVIYDFKPTIIFTHNDSEVNIDHVITHNAVEVAARPNIKSILHSIYLFEIPCSGNFKFLKNFNPNVYVDIEKFRRKKYKAWSCFEHETRPYPFPRSVDALDAIAKYRGLQSGIKYAEGFFLARQKIIV